MSNNNYRYPGDIDMSIITSNPEEYIVQECLAACEKLWANNIFTVSCSNRDEKKDKNGIIKKYIMLSHNLSSDNVEIFENRSNEKPKSYLKQRISDTVYYIIIIESEDNNLDLDSKKFLDLFRDLFIFSYLLLYKTLILGYFLYHPLKQTMIHFWETASKIFIKY